jgi:hypothetical protein
VPAVQANYCQPYWYPSFKLVEKVKRDNGRYQKVYEKAPKTPCERLIESPDVSAGCKAELRRREVLYNPVLLNRSLNEAVERLLHINREKSMFKRPPVRRLVRPSRPNFGWILVSGQPPLPARKIFRQCGVLTKYHYLYMILVIYLPVEL